MDGSREKIHQRKKLKQKLGGVKSKIWLKKFGKDHKNREKNLQFFGVNESKIQWMVLEKKFIKGKNLNENWEA